MRRRWSILLFSTVVALIGDVWVAGEHWWKMQFLLMLIAAVLALFAVIRDLPDKGFAVSTLALSVLMLLDVLESLGDLVRGEGYVHLSLGFVLFAVGTLATFGTSIGILTMQPPARGRA